MQNAIAVSRDSLQCTMSLLPYAELMKDEDLSKHLKEVGDVEVKAGYEFLQMDGGVRHFVLHPKDVNVSGGYISMIYMFWLIHGEQKTIGENKYNNINLKKQSI